ncbi:hypothetical protein [Oxalobacter aliiformigenes]|uniref:hypothetical protein n=1 Tax=Oxalobacter aliiformigenes TaxID=2946593 RepID=UPI0022AFF6D8|nr:hypothetical protein [Oxalobacter aliiformigenes]
MHAKYGEYEIVLFLDGEILEGAMPKRPLALIGAIHEKERYKTWIKAVRQENPDKIEPLKGWYLFISRIWKNAVEYGGIVSAMLPANKPANRSYPVEWLFASTVLYNRRIQLFRCRAFIEW